MKIMENLLRRPFNTTKDFYTSVVMNETFRHKQVICDR